MEIQHWATENPAAVDVQATLRDAIELMHHHKIGAVLVTRSDRLVGIFSERDLIRVAAEAPRIDDTIKVADVMTPDPITAQADDDYNVVYMLMKVNNIRHIPILDGKRIAGIVSIRDLTHFYQHKLESEYAEARERIDVLKRLINLSTDEVLDSLFSEINRYKELSLTDHLTGLYNKRYFMRRLREETARAHRYKQCLSLIFCDIDRFKRINDQYGHHAGDEILRQIGALLAGGIGEMKIVSRLRKSDIVARYGGEEFVIILPETSTENARIAAEKMRVTIEAHPFCFADDKLAVTMSFGVAGVDSDVRTPEDFIRRADIAMYRAKQNGRNRVEVFRPDFNSGYGSAAPN